MKTVDKQKAVRDFKNDNGLNIFQADGLFQADGWKDIDEDGQDLDNDDNYLDNDDGWKDVKEHGQDYAGSEEYSFRSIDKVADKENQNHRYLTQYT